MILSQLWFAIFNIINVYIDAYKITKLNKKIRHGINFSAYFLFVCIIAYFSSDDTVHRINIIVSALFNRQFTFDIPLNLRRGLAWNYVTSQDPPGSILDRVEIFLFKRNGTLPFIFYGIFWILTLFIC